MNTSSHYFFAVTLPEVMKESLYYQSQQIRTEYSFKKWLHRDDYHLTLAFLGSASDSQRQKAIQLVETILKNEDYFTLTLNGIGIFGNKNSPRILWAGVEEEVKLRTIQKKVYDTCITAGFALDQKNFTPHITLARKYTGELFSLERLQQQADSKDTTKFAVTTVSLYQTHIGVSPSYESIYSFHLHDGIHKEKQ